MKSIFTYEDEHLGKSYIVISKIREVSTALGNMVITFDNGDKISVDVADTKEAISHILEAIEKFYA